MESQTDKDLMARCIQLTRSTAWDLAADCLKFLDSNPRPSLMKMGTRLCQF